MVRMTKKKFMALAITVMMIFNCGPVFPLLEISGNAADIVPLSVAPAEPPIYKDETYSYAERAADLVARMTLAEKGSQTAGYNSSAIPRLGISAYMWWNEAHHGIMQEGWFSRYTTAASYPTNYSIGATWDPELYYDEAVEIGANTREMVKDNAYNLTMFSPTINLARDPRWGRNDEIFSEDPLLTGVMGASFVKGLEGKNYDGSYKKFNPNKPDEGVKRVVTTIKHYMANNSERNRYTSGADNVTHREFREYYTRPARIIIKDADVSSVMMAYSSTNGIPISLSSYYMDTVLRQYFGFSGYIVTDCDSNAVSYNRSVHRFSNPHTLEKYTLGESYANSMANGLDLQCNAGETDGLGSYASNLKKMLNNEDGNGVVTDKGKFTEQQLEVSVHRMMTARMQLGEFDAVNEWAQIGKNDWEAGMAGTFVDGVRGLTQERIDLAEDVHRSSVVMVKNDNNLLPIKESDILSKTGTYKVGIIGPVGQSTHRGSYSGTLPSGTDDQIKLVTIENGIKKAFRETYGASAQGKLEVEYHYGYSSARNRTGFSGLSANSITFAQLPLSGTGAVTDKAVPADLDLAVIVVGQGSGDSREDGDRPDLHLAPAQAELVRAVKERLNPGKVVLIMESYGQTDIPEDILEYADAILLSSFGGLRKVGYGEIITGKTNPNGRLNGTWLRNMATMTPGIYNYSLLPEDGQGGRTYMYNTLGTLWPFGFGLSFSEVTFAKSGASLFGGVAAENSLNYNNNITKDTTIDVNFSITNTNNVAGKQVAQVYVVSPNAGNGEYPLKRLVGFKKVDVGANATVPVSIPIAATDLAFFNEAKDCYELPEGTWAIHVALSSDITDDAVGIPAGYKSSKLSETFTVSNGSIREDPVVISAKPTQYGDDEYGLSGAEIINGVSERIIFKMSADPTENVIDPGLGITMANEKLYGKRVINNNPGYDIGVDPAKVNAYVKSLTSDSPYYGWKSPDVAGEAAIGRVETAASPKPQIGMKYELPAGYTVEFASNRPGVVAIGTPAAAAGAFAKGEITMVGSGVATISAKVTNASTGESATTDFIVYVKGDAGLSNLTVGGTPIDGFDPDTLDYRCVVPAGSDPQNAAFTVVGTPVDGVTVTYSTDGKNFAPAATGLNPLSMFNTGGSDEPIAADHKQNGVYIKVTGAEIAEQIYVVKFEEEMSAVNFVGGNIGDKWDIVREDDTKYEAVGGYGLKVVPSVGAITGQFRRTTGLSAVGTRSYTNVFTRPAGGDWTITAKITSPALPTAVTPMMLIWDDDDSWIRMNFAGGGAGANKTATLTPLIQGQNNGNVTGATNVPGDPNKPFVGYYKLVREGLTFTGYTSPDGLNWTQIKTADGRGTSESQYFIDPQLALFVTGGVTGTTPEKDIPIVCYEFIDVSTERNEKTDQKILDDAYAAVVDYLKTLDLGEMLSGVKGNIVLPVPFDYAVKVETTSPNIKPDGTVTPPAAAENVNVKISITHPNAYYNGSHEYEVYDGSVGLLPADFGVSRKTLTIDRTATPNTGTFDVNLGSAARATVVSGTTSVATVAAASAAFTENGTATITGVGAGSSNVTVNFYDGSGKVLGTETVVVTVTSGGPAFDGTVSTELLSLVANASTGNTFTVGLGSAASATVSSSDTNIATAILSGDTVTVDALNRGTAVITVSYYDGPNGTGSLRGTQRVTVIVSDDLGSLIGTSSVDTTSLTVPVGETKTFKVNIDNVAIQQVGISSSNTDIATVTPAVLTESGEVSVTGATVGNTTVEVKWWGMPNNVDLGVTSIITVNVTESTTPSPDKTKLNNLIALAEELVEDDYLAEEWEALQEALGNAKEVSDDGDATQDEVDDAVAALEAAIEALKELIPVTSIKINSVATTIVRKNKTLQLGVILTPSNANFGTEIKWASSNEASVKVDAETGLLTGVKAGGSARVTATSSNGKTYTITVTVDS